MAHYEMYFCLPSSAYDSAVGAKIKALYPIVESVADDGTITYKSAPTWHEIIFAGKVGAPRYSHDKSFCIIKGEWSMKDGVLSDGGVSDEATAKGEIARIYNAGKRSHR